jgi:GrpB-like predicted nucleotidyltransferase (UPF0157 family)
LCDVCGVAPHQHVVALSMDEIEIVDYDPLWPAEFEKEARAIQLALHGHQTLAIEHAGSTAIAGLAAKPIIDIYIAVRTIAGAKAALVRPLEALGYLYWRENPNTDQMFFVKGLPPRGKRRTHHIHVAELGSDAWRRPLLFRDYLRAHPDEAKEYLDLKLRLAKQHHSDREAYTGAKDAFVEAIIRRAKVED